jgi:phosphoglycolate phosphatase
VNLSAVLFDFDGTLADSYAGIAASVNHVRAAHRLPPMTADDVRRHVGRGVEYLLSKLIPDHDPAGDVALYREHHPTVMRQGTRLLPGAVEALTAAKAAGCRTAICSNKKRPFTVELVRHLRLDGFVDAVLGPEDVAAPKPAPDMLTAALLRLGVPAARALFVGDMAIDVQTARAAGTAVFVVATGSDEPATLRAAGPDRMMSSLFELAGLLSPGCCG